MKIDLQGSLGLYGVEVFVQSLAYYLKQMRVEVSVTPPFGRFLIRGGKRYPAILHGLGDESVRSRADGTSDLTHLNYAFASLPTLLRGRSRTPLLYTVHGVPQADLEHEPLFKIGYTLEKMSLKYVASRAAKVIAISEYVRRLLEKNYGIRSDVIHNGVDTELFRPLMPNEKHTVRDSLAISRNEKTILFVGRLYPYKDPLTLIRCVPKVIEKCPDAVFTFVGDGPLKKTMRSEASRMGVERFVRIIPYLQRSKLVEWFQVADAFVSTSPTEMFGFSVLEAMSCGTPVVAADSGGPIEVLGNSGSFFRHSDEIDLAEKLSSTIQDEDLKAGLGRAERDIVVQRFRWEDVARRYKDAYEGVITHR